MNNTSTPQLKLSQIIPMRTRIRLLLVWMVVFAFMFMGESFQTESLNPLKAGIAFVVVLSTIIFAAFGVVKEADELAHKLGEPFGTLILTLSIVSIEVILIAAVMLGPGSSETIGKDSIFSVMMIIMNLVMGLCILLGGLKYGEQEYNAQGTITYMGMIIMLGGIGMLLPNYIQGAGGGAFNASQAIVISSLVIFLYAMFLKFQTGKYSHLYVQPNAGSMSVAYEDRAQVMQKEKSAGEKGSKFELIIRTLVLLATILPIVLLSHYLATVVDYGIAAANLPAQIGGVLIAIIVFTPESMTAVKAALNNEFQRAINLCHGAFVSTVGLTIPCVLIIGLLSGNKVLLGMQETEVFLFIITLLLSVFTFLGKKTTPFVGIMHLVLFVLFLLLIFNP